MEFKHLKLFGMSSAVTLLFCFDADGMNWQQALRNIGIREGNQRLVDIANTPISQLRNGVVVSDQNRAKGVNKEKNKKEEKKDNSFSVNLQKNTKSSDIRKIQYPPMVHERAFSKWMGGFEKGLIAPEELHFFSNSADYFCLLIDQGTAVKRNGVEYGNQCSILALNLDKGTMRKIYDEMDRFDDYGHNFAQYIERHNGLDDGNGELWRRISEIIEHRICVYSRQSNGTLSSVIFGGNDLPIKRIYLKKGHYRELLIRKTINYLAEKLKRELACGSATDSDVEEYPDWDDEEVEQPGESMDDNDSKTYYSSNENSNSSEYYSDLNSEYYSDSNVEENLYLGDEKVKQQSTDISFAEQIANEDKIMQQKREEKLKSQKENKSQDENPLAGTMFEPYSEIMRTEFAKRGVNSLLARRGVNSLQYQSILGNMSKR